MSLRARFSGSGSYTLAREPRPLHSWRSGQHKHCSRRILQLTRLTVQATSDATNGPDAGAAAQVASAPDPWAAGSSSHSDSPGDADLSSVSMNTLAATLTTASAATVPPAADSAATAHTPPPSPWDATVSQAAGAARPGAAAWEPGDVGEATRSYEFDENDPVAAAAAAAAVAAAAAAAAAAAEGTQHEHTDGASARGSSSSASGSSSSTPMDGSFAVVADRASSSTSASSSSSAVTAGVDSSSSSSNGGSGSGGDVAAPFNLREASAGLSEDTAALLSRLRAELARTSNIPMPPRRTGGNSNSTTANAATNAAASTTARSGSSSSGSSNKPVADAASGSKLIPPISSPAAAAPPPSPRPTPPPLPPAAVPPGIPAASRSPAPAPKPPVTMSEEALAAALAASGLPTPQESGSSRTGSESSYDSDADTDADAGASAAFTPLRLPSLPPALGNLLGGFLRRRGIPSGTESAAAAAASSPAVAPPSPPSSSSPSSPFAGGGPTIAIPGGSTAANTPTLNPTSVPGAVAGSSSSSSSGSSRSSAGASSSSSSSSGGSSSVDGGPGRKRKAVVVGGGIGGLVSAARLAKEGFAVTLLEANSQVGGRCQSLQRGRFRFDTGPSLLLFIETYRRAFAALGTSLAQQVPVVRVTPAAYRVFFQGAGSLDLLYDVQRMVEQLEGVEKGAGGQYLDWLASARAALELGVEGFISRDAESLPELLTRALQDDELRALLTSVGVAELLGPHHSRMARRFRDPRLRALFTFQDLYVGLTPYDAPGVYSLLAATELTDGVWYPLGGFGQIRDALLRVGQSLGVRLRCGARVAAIRTAPGEGGGQVVSGVTLASGEELDADVVVSNRDVPLTYELLRGPAETHGSATARRLLAQDYSAGVISFNWSVDRKLDQLLHHNVFLSGDFEGSWVRATSADTLSRSPNFYVHCPGRTDPTACPPRSDSVMVLLPVANIQEVVKAQEAERHRGSPLGSLPAGLPSALSSSLPSSYSSTSSSYSAAVDYSALVAAGREAVLRSMAEAGITDVRQHIVDELVIDPVEWRDRYSLAHGAAFGLSHGLSQLSVLRPPLADKQVRGLYLVGASTRPGNGVPLTMIGADLVTEKVMQDLSAGVI